MGRRPAGRCHGDAPFHLAAAWRRRRPLLPSFFYRVSLSTSTIVSHWPQGRLMKFHRAEEEKRSSRYLVTRISISIEMDGDVLFFILFCYFDIRVEPRPRHSNVSKINVPHSFSAFSFRLFPPSWVRLGQQSAAGLLPSFGFLLQLLLLPAFLGRRWRGSHLERVVPSFTGFPIRLLGFTRSLSSFTGFYLVLLGFTGFYRVLPGFIGFY